MDTYRTVVNSGTFGETLIDNIVEIDICKAFTHALTQINNIPIFNEFDIFKTYNGETIEPLTLYLIKIEKETLMFNKRFNLCFGMFLQDVDKIDIIYYKKPSLILDIDDYLQTCIAELYATQICDNPDEDLRIKN